MVLRSITKTISINVSPNEVFSFIANAETWPKWALVNVKSISKGEGEWWTWKPQSVQQSYELGQTKNSVYSTMIFSRRMQAGLSLLESCRMLMERNS